MLTHGGMSRGRRRVKTFLRLQGIFVENASPISCAFSNAHVFGLTDM